MSPFAQSLCQAQISILEIFHIFLWLKFSPSLTLAKIEHFSKVFFRTVSGETPIMLLFLLSFNKLRFQNSGRGYYQSIRVYNREIDPDFQGAGLCHRDFIDQSIIEFRPEILHRKFQDRPHHQPYGQHPAYPPHNRFLL